MTSLERWVRTRGALFSASAYSKRAVTIQLWVGGACLVGAFGFLAAPLFGSDWHIVFGGLGPGIAGITNIVVPLTLRKRFEAMRPVTVPLTSEARAVMTALNRKYLGRGYPWAWNGGHWRDEREAWSGRGYAGSSWHGNQEALPELSDQVIEDLEQAAFQYNRVAALIATANPGQGAVARMAAKISTSADEAMAEILHQCGMLGTYPEGSDAVRVRLEGAILELKELADRVHDLSLSEPTFTERLANRSGLRDVLDDLRLEQAARTELGQPRDEQRQSQ